MFVTMGSPVALSSTCPQWHEAVLLIIACLDMVKLRQRLVSAVSALGRARATGRFKYSFRGGRILFQCGDRTDGPTYELASAVGAPPFEYALGAGRTEGALE